MSRRRIAGLTLRRLSWEGVGWAVSTLVKGMLVASVDGRHPCARPGIYGPPRGGLILAVALSHALNIPYLRRPVPGCLWVDDIYDTGRTLAADRARCADLFPCVWVGRHGCPVLHARAVDDDVWIVFPWEADRDAFMRARSYAKILKRRVKSAA